MGFLAVISLRKRGCENRFLHKWKNQTKKKKNLNNIKKSYFFSTKSNNFWWPKILLQSLNYKIEALLNNSNAVIITNGVVNLPSEPSTDFWGTSGNNVLILQANDVLTVNYHLKGPSALSITSYFFNIGLSKL